MEEGAESSDAEADDMHRAPQREKNAAFQVSAASTPTQVRARSPEYARVLERYLDRKSTRLNSSH